jgi:hypothetical protein
MDFLIGKSALAQASFLLAGPEELVARGYQPGSHEYDRARELTRRALVIPDSRALKEADTCVA